MAKENLITYRKLKDVGFDIVGQKFFGKTGILLKPEPILPIDQKYPVKGDSVYTLEVIEPEAESGREIKTWDELYSFLKPKSTLQRKD